ncbi:hypothetical protein [Streptomyces sp. NPDC048106]
MFCTISTCEPRVSDPAHHQPLNPDEHADPDIDWPALPTDNMLFRRNEP